MLNFREHFCCFIQITSLSELHLSLQKVDNFFFEILTMHFFVGDSLVFFQLCFLVLVITEKYAMLVENLLV